MSATDKMDREWLIAGGACVAIGALASVITGRKYWYAIGAVGGAGLVWYRLSHRSKVCSGHLRRILDKRPDFDRLGAPEIPAVEVPNVGTPQPISRAEVEGFPMRFRVPDTEIHFDTMDDRIKPHFVGPMGPENDPVVHW